MTQVIRIVDDDPHIHDALGFLLETEGYAVRHYLSAEAFMEEDPLFEPGCAVVDVRMGGISGLTLYQQMLAHGVKLPVIFLSAHGDVDMAVGAIEAGAVTFLTKPVRAEKLFDAIEKALIKAKNEMTPQNVPEKESNTDTTQHEVSLSEREYQVVTLAAGGLSNRLIGERLGIQTRTVEYHRAGGMRKLGCHNAEELRRAVEALKKR